MCRLFKSDDRIREICSKSTELTKAYHEGLFESVAKCKTPLGIDVEYVLSEYSSLIPYLKSLFKFTNAFSSETIKEDIKDTGEVYVEKKGDMSYFYINSMIAFTFDNSNSKLYMFGTDEVEETIESICLISAIKQLYIKLGILKNGDATLLINTTKKFGKCYYGFSPLNVNTYSMSNMQGAIGLCLIA